MATILEPAIGQKKRSLHAVKIDMTPMVDLGFLLITFFIFTTALLQPNVTKLVMPKEDRGIQTVYEKTLLTAILDKGNVTVYEGAFEKAAASSAVRKTDYNVSTGMGEVVRQKQKALQAAGLKEDLTVLIKPSPDASYQEVLNALDEMLINGVHHYGIVNPTPEEKAYLAANRF